MYKDKLIKQIPNLLTMTNMLFGLTAIMILMRTDFYNKELTAVALIIFGGVIDFFDGYLARKLDAVTELGKQLDSFADLVTFGIAPVCLVHYLTLCGHSIFITFLSLVFPIAGIYRLARYNINDFNNYFMGLPITAAGMLLAVYCAIHTQLAYHLRHHAAFVVITIVFIFLLSVLMVSRVKVKRLLFLNQNGRESDIETDSFTD